MIDSKNPHIDRLHVPKGGVIFEEGDDDRHFFIIEQGSVEIVTSLGGKEKILALIKPGESFGEFALLDHSVRSASARAAEDSVVVRVSEEGYEHLLSELPTWASYMLRSFASRLKNMNRVLKGLS